MFGKGLLASCFALHPPGQPNNSNRCAHPSTWHSEAQCRICMPGRNTCSLSDALVAKPWGKDRGIYWTHHLTVMLQGDRWVKGGRLAIFLHFFFVSWQAVHAPCSNFFFFPPLQLLVLWRFFPWLVENERNIEKFICLYYMLCSLAITKKWRGREREKVESSQSTTL